MTPASLPHSLGSESFLVPLVFVKATGRKWSQQLPAWSLSQCPTAIPQAVISAGRHNVSFQAEAMRRLGMLTGI